MTASASAADRVRWARARPPASSSTRFFRFFAVVVVVQGIHVIEHVIQLVQVMAYGIPDDDALGLLGEIIEFNGTEEWLHLGFNALYLASLYVLVVNFDRITDSIPVPRWVFLVFLVGAAGFETWHMAEHVVIISHVIANSGCPCPGIGDQALSVTDTQLHFVYNTLAYTSTLVPFWFVAKVRRGGGTITPRRPSHRPER